GESADGLLSFSASAFWNDTTDEQFFIFNPLVGQFQVENADSESYGAEFEFGFRPTDSLLFTSSIGLLNAEAVESSNQGSVQAGNEVPYAPAFTASNAMQFLFPEQFAGLSGDLVFRLEHQFIGERFIDPANTFELDSYHIVNARLVYKEGPVELFLFARNLLDEEYIESGFSAGRNAATGAPVIGGIPGLPVTYGIGAGITF
ncbi:MAG: TonB-dependent receptor, partial [Verrucomicrobiota bacterium]